MSPTEDSAEHSSKPSQDRTRDVLPSVDQIGNRLDALLASVPVLPPDEKVEFQIGRFKIDRRLGYGSFGVVYGGYDPELDRPVAVKLPRPEVLADREKRERFAAEANLAASLEHPGIVPVYEARLEGPTPYLVSKLIAGPSLAKWLAGVEELPAWPDVARFVAKIADAVHHAHRQGVFHRDLKPSNVLLVPIESSEPNQSIHGLSAYEPRLTDFGLAKLADANLTDTRSSLMIGTPLYMAPEQIEGKRIEQFAAFDIYSMGVILFELLSGFPPRNNLNYAELLDSFRNDSVPSILKIRTDNPRVLDRICQRCLALNPAARYESAQALATDLKKCAAGESVAVDRLGLRQRFDYWLRQPKRITDAGRFALWSQLLLIVWLLVSLVPAGLWRTLSFAAYIESLRDVLIATTTIQLPLALIGYLTLQRKHWAIVAGLCWSAAGSLTALLPAFTKPMLFSVLYDDEDAFIVVAMHILIAVPYVTCFLLYLFACIGSRKQKR